MNDYNINHSFIQLSEHPFHLTIIGKKNFINVSELFSYLLKYFRSFYKTACTHRRQSLDRNNNNNLLLIISAKYMWIWSKALFISCAKKKKKNQMNFFCDLRLHAQNISSCKPDILWFARETLDAFQSITLIYENMCRLRREFFFRQ